MGAVGAVSGAVERGVAAFNAGRPREALALFRRAARAGEGGGALGSFIAHCLAALGRGEQARAEFRRLARARPGDPAAQRAWAAALSAAGRAEEAGRVLERAARRRRGDAQARRAWADYLRARALRLGAEGRTAQARGCWRRLARLGDAQAAEQLRALALERARRLREAGRLKQALAALRRVPGPAEHPERALELGAVLWGLGRFEQAERALAKLVRRDPGDARARAKLVEVLSGRAAACLEAGRGKEAEALSRRLAALGAEPAAAQEPAAERALRERLEGWREELGRAGLAARREREILRGLRRAAASAARRRDAGGRTERARVQECYRARAMACLKAGELAGAERALREALAQDEDLLDLEKMLIELLGQRGDESGQARLWRRALRPGGGLARGLDRYCALLGLGRLREAFEEGERVLDLDGGPATTRRLCFFPGPQQSRLQCRCDLAGLSRLRLAPRLEPWRQLFRGIATGEPAFFKPLSSIDHGRYGWMLQRAGWGCLHARAFSQALSWFRLAARLKPLDWKTFAWSAEAWLCLGDRRAAFASLERAAREAPIEERAEAWAWRGELHLWIGEYAAAGGWLERARAGGAAWAEAWLAGVELKLQRPQRALPLLERALSLHPCDHEARVWKAEALRALGRPREALAELALAPGSAWAAINRALILASRGPLRVACAPLKALPEVLADGLAGALGVDGRRAASRAELEGYCRGALELARGYRREENFAWAILSRG